MDEYNCLIKLKICKCAYGGQQIAGLDFDRSYTSVILATSLHFFYAVHLSLWIYHNNVFNAFQSPLDPDEKTYLCCHPEYLLWSKSHHPDAY